MVTHASGLQTEWTLSTGSGGTLKTVAAQDVGHLAAQAHRIGHATEPWASLANAIVLRRGRFGHSAWIVLSSSDFILAFGAMTAKTGKAFEPKTATITVTDVGNRITVSLVAKLQSATEIIGGLFVFCEFAAVGYQSSQGNLAAPRYFQYNVPTFLWADDQSVSGPDIRYDPSTLRNAAVVKYPFSSSDTEGLFEWTWPEILKHLGFTFTSPTPAEIKASRKFRPINICSSYFGYEDFNAREEILDYLGLDYIATGPVGDGFSTIIEKMVDLTVIQQPSLGEYENLICGGGLVQFGSLVPDRVGLVHPQVSQWEYTGSNLGVLALNMDNRWPVAFGNPQNGTNASGGIGVFVNEVTQKLPGVTGDAYLLAHANAPFWAEWSAGDPTWKTINAEDQVIVDLITKRMLAASEGINATYIGVLPRLLLGSSITTQAIYNRGAGTFTALYTDPRIQMPSYLETSAAAAAPFTSFGKDPSPIRPLPRNIFRPKSPAVWFPACNIRITPNVTANRAGYISDNSTDLNKRYLQGNLLQAYRQNGIGEPVIKKIPVLVEPMPAAAYDNTIPTHYRGSDGRLRLYGKTYEDENDAPTFSGYLVGFRTETVNGVSKKWPIYQVVIPAAEIACVAEWEQAEQGGWSAKFKYDHLAKYVEPWRMIVKEDDRVVGTGIPITKGQEIADELSTWVSDGAFVRATDGSVSPEWVMRRP